MHHFDKTYRKGTSSEGRFRTRQIVRENRRPLLRLVIACWFASLAVAAYSSLEGPSDRVRNLLESVSDVLENPVDAKAESRGGKAEAVKGLIEANFDHVEMARGALEGTWTEITDEERVEFLSLFKTLFLESYTKLVLNFLKREELEITGESDAGGLKKVLTRIRRKNDEIPVSYYLKKRDGRWLIVEVDVDGVGIVGNYNRAFGKVIHRSSFAALVERMRIQERALQGNSESE